MCRRKKKVLMVNSIHVIHENDTAFANETFFPKKNNRSIVTVVEVIGGKTASSGFHIFTDGGIIKWEAM